MGSNTSAVWPASLTNAELAKYAWLLVCESPQMSEDIKPWFVELVKRLEVSVDDGK